MLEEEDEDECPVCFEAFAKRIVSRLPCAHVVCLRCLTRLPSPQCPLCRRALDLPWVSSSGIPTTTATTTLSLTVRPTQAASIERLVQRLVTPRLVRHVTYRSERNDHEEEGEEVYSA